jgi:hypothetical protein
MALPVRFENDIFIKFKPKIEGEAALPTIFCVAAPKQ